jgi:flagellar assembly protein FliH
MSVDVAFSELRYPTIATAGLEEETERARIRGHAAGYAEGLRVAEAGAAADAARARVEREALREDAVTALTAAVDALGTATRRFAASSAPVLAAADDALLAAAIELAESIIGIELANGETSARAAIARALSSAAEETITTVRLSPVDLAVIGAHGITVPEVRLVADPTLSPGDAVVELEDGRLEARVASSLARARAEIGGAR